MSHRFFNMGIVVFGLSLFIGACSDDDNKKEERSSPSGPRMPTNALKFTASNAQKIIDMSIPIYSRLAGVTDGDPQTISTVDGCATITGAQYTKGKAGITEFTLEDCPYTFLISGTLSSYLANGNLSFNFDEENPPNHHYILTGNLKLTSIVNLPVKEDTIEITDIRVEISHSASATVDQSTTTVAFGVSSSVLGGGFLITTPATTPIIMTEKIGTDAATTIGELLFQGAESSKIKVIFNNSDTELLYSFDDGSGIFKPLIP